jgi:hypothetical protein
MPRPDQHTGQVRELVRELDATSLPPSLWPYHPLPSWPHHVLMSRKALFERQQRRQHEQRP